MSIAMAMFMAMVVVIDIGQTNGHGSGYGHGDGHDMEATCPCWLKGTIVSGMSPYPQPWSRSNPIAQLLSAIPLRTRQLLLPSSCPCTCLKPAVHHHGVRPCSKQAQCSWLGLWFPVTQAQVGAEVTVAFPIDHNRSSLLL